MRTTVPKPAVSFDVGYGSRRSNPSANLLAISGIVCAESCVHHRFFKPDIPTVKDDTKHTGYYERRDCSHRKRASRSTERKTQIHGVSTPSEEACCDELVWRVECHDVGFFGFEHSCG